MSTTNAVRFCRNGHRVAARWGGNCPLCGEWTDPSSGPGRAYAVRWVGSFVAFFALVAVLVAVLAGGETETINPYPAPGDDVLIEPAGGTAPIGLR